VIDFLLIKKKEKLNDIWFVNTVGALYAEIKTDSKAALMFNVCFVSRRIIFSGVALALGDYQFG
jgi:hypothetical protein